MTVVLDRPYEFIPPHEGHRWPDWIQRLRLYDLYLRKSEGVVDFEVEQLEIFRREVQSGRGIVLAPNHCRYADPLVMGWPARLVGTHLYAMASWHLFNRGQFDTFAIRRMGAFSINRESVDRAAIDYAINILVSATRPLIIYPEGATYRTNDILKPLLAGAFFIARAAARRAAKQDRKVVLLPAAMKYLCVDPVAPWADRQLTDFENRFGWRTGRVGGVRDDAVDPTMFGTDDQSLIRRTRRVAAALVGIKESQFDVAPPGPGLAQRRDHMIETLLSRCERELAIVNADASTDADHTPVEPVEGATDDPAVTRLAIAGARVRAIRSEIHNRFWSKDDATDPDDLRRLLKQCETAMDLSAFHDAYLSDGQVTDTRLVETIQRIQESVLGRADASMRLKAVIRFDDAIEVPPTKAPRGQIDPLSTAVRTSLETMLADLQTRTRRLNSSMAAPGSS